MNNLIRTTRTFSTRPKAETFAAWLRRYIGDSDFGTPRLIDVRDVGDEKTCVEYECRGHYVNGVADGIEFGCAALESENAKLKLEKELAELAMDLEVATGDELRTASDRYSVVTDLLKKS